MYNKWTLQQRDRGIISGSLCANEGIEPLLLTLGMALGGIVSQCYTKGYTVYNFADNTVLKLYLTIKESNDDKLETKEE